MHFLLKLLHVMPRERVLEESIKRTFFWYSVDSRLSLSLSLFSKFITFTKKKNKNYINSKTCYHVFQVILYTSNLQIGSTMVKVLPSVEVWQKFPHSLLYSRKDAKFVSRIGIAMTSWTQLGFPILLFFLDYFCKSDPYLWL